jgi:hypothetical protein
MEYAEAMPLTPPAVTDELSARLLDELGAPARVELAAFHRAREHVRAHQHGGGAGGGDGPRRAAGSR